MGRCGGWSPPTLRRTRATADAPWRPCWGATPYPGRRSRVGQLGEGLAPPQPFIQRLARHPQQARRHPLIAGGVP